MVDPASNANPPSFFSLADEVAVLESALTGCPYIKARPVEAATIRAIIDVLQTPAINEGNFPGYGS